MFIFYLFQISSVEETSMVEDENIEAEAEEADEAQGEVVVEQAATNYPMYIVPADDKNKTQVVIYHDDSIR